MRTKTFAELLSGYTTAVQAGAAGLVDFTQGSILRACGEGIGQVALWLQGLILALLAASRASTATGADLDSFYADFGFERIAAVKASGVVTFSRLTTTAAGLVPTGVNVSTGDGELSFKVQTDEDNPAWDAGLMGYVLDIGEDSVDVPVRATVAGAAGNVSAGQANTIASNIPGIDTATNAGAFTGGADAETDTAYRVRFHLYLASLATANVAAVGRAISSTPGVTDYSIVENEDPDGTPHPGFFYATIDDGTGAPSTGLKDAVTAAVEAVRPIGLDGGSAGFSIESPSVLTKTVSMTVTVDSGYNGTTVKTEVHDALVAYINGLGLGVKLPYTRLAQVAYDASAGVINVASVLLQSGTSDITATAKQVIRAGTVTIS